MCLSHIKKDWTFNILVFGSSKCLLLKGVWGWEGGWLRGGLISGIKKEGYIRGGGAYNRYFRVFFVRVRADNTD